MPPDTSTSQANLSQLRELLQQRVKIIADHEWRDRDSAAHLDALKTVSEAIDTFHRDNHGVLDARLRHYLANASYQKALDWVS